MYRYLFEKKDTYSLRGICMLMIMIAHVCQQNDYQFVGIGKQLMYLLEKGGFLGTSVFLLLSGYGCFFSFSKGKMSFSFICEKLIRIVKPFVVASFFLFVIRFFILDKPGGILDTMQQLFTLSLSYEVPLPSPNVNMWFLKIIFILYVITLSVFYIFKTPKNRILATTFVVALLCIYLFSQGYPQFIYVLTICFPIGLCCGMKSFGLNTRFENNRLGISVTLFFVFLICYVANSRIHSPFLSLASSVSFSFFSVCLACILDLKNKIFDYIGTHSILFYLFHILFLYPISLLTNNILLYTLLMFILTVSFVIMYNNLGIFIKSKLGN